jgi:anti-sigma B factor antagonist
LAGEIDFNSAWQLREGMLESISAGTSRVVVDLGDVPLMDSTGIGVLVFGLVRLQERGGWLRLASVHPPIVRVLEILQLTQELPVYPTVEAALADVLQGRDGATSAENRP